MIDNEKLKKKICDIVAPYISAWGDDERIADALIAAGIRFGENLTATFDHMALEREHELERRLAEAERRAEVAERALLNACFVLARNYYTDGGDWVRFRDEFVAYYKKQAEKEIAEERKDEN